MSILEGEKNTHVLMMKPNLLGIKKNAPFLPEVRFPLRQGETLAGERVRFGGNPVSRELGCRGKRRPESTLGRGERETGCVTREGKNDESRKKLRGLSSRYTKKKKLGLMNAGRKILLLLWKGTRPIFGIVKGTVRVPPERNQLCVWKEPGAAVTRRETDERSSAKNFPDTNT